MVLHLTDKSWTTPWCNSSLINPWTTQITWLSIKKWNHVSQGCSYDVELLLMRNALFLQQDCIIQSLVALSNYCLYYTFNWFVTKVTISQLINIWHRWVYLQPINPSRSKLNSYVPNVTTTVCNLSYKVLHIKSKFQTLVIFLQPKSCFRELEFPFNTSICS